LIESYICYMSTALTIRRRWFDSGPAGSLVLIAMAALALAAYHIIGFGGPYLGMLFLAVAFFVTWNGSPAVPIVAMLAIQAVATAMFLFAPIGFEQPSDWGLDWTDAVGLFVVGLFALTAGLIASVTRRYWGFVALHLVVLLISVAIFATVDVSYTSTSATADSGPFDQNAMQ
jgi:hypothetical protein